MRVNSAVPSLLAAVGGVTLACSSAAAAPLVVEESVRITLPDTSYTSIHDVAIDGDFVIIGASKRVGGTTEPPFNVQAAFLFQRASNGSWSFIRKLAERADDEDFRIEIRVAMDDGIAAVTLGGFDPNGMTSYLHVFERTASGWVAVPAQGTPEGRDLEIDAGTILASDGTCSWEAQAFRKNTASAWALVSQLGGESRGCDDEFRGGDVDISGPTPILAEPSSEDPGFKGSAWVYEGQPGAWSLQILTGPDPDEFFGSTVAIENETAIIAGTPQTGLHVLRRRAPHDWIHETAILPPDSLMTPAGPATMEMENGFLLRDHSFGVSVFQRDTSGTYQYVAKLPGARRPDMSGRRVAAIGNGAVLLFDLPASFAQPATRQDDFNDGNSAGWAPQAGSMFSVASAPTSRVYRQSSLAGNATSLLLGTDWTNQAIQAEVRPTAFDGGDRWFGLAVRYTDAGNYYYVTARSSNVVQLRRIVNGSFQTLASVTLPVTLNRSYALRLEAVGTLLRLYVDGVLRLEARDTALTHGQAGVIMYKTRADYDNVIVSANRLTPPLFNDDFQDGLARYWTPSGGTWSVVTDGGSQVYQQSSLAGGASSVTGIASTADQVIQARAKATAFSGADRWFGLMARYNDPGNYYYVTARSSNTISLRKLLNGAIVTLDSAPFPVTTGTWYTLRLEAIGSSLRAYVNNQLVLEAQDTSFATGSYGAAMYKAAVRYDDVRVVEP